jgi:hypothetical protein
VLIAQRPHLARGELAAATAGACRCQRCGGHVCRWLPVGVCHGCQWLPGGYRWLPGGCQRLHLGREGLDLVLERIQSGGQSCQHEGHIWHRWGRLWLPCHVLEERLADDGCQRLPVAATRFELGIEVGREADGDAALLGHGRALGAKHRVIPGPEVGQEALPDGIDGEVEAFEDKGAQQDGLAHDQGTHVKGAPHQLDGDRLGLVIDAIAAIGHGDGLGPQPDEPELLGQRVGHDEMHGTGIHEGFGLHGMDLGAVEMAKACQDQFAHIVQGDLDV